MKFWIFISGEIFGGEIDNLNILNLMVAAEAVLRLAHRASAALGQVRRGAQRRHPTPSAAGPQRRQA